MYLLPRITLPFFAALMLFGNFAFCENKTDQAALKAYFNYLDLYPKTLGPDGNASKGEIEIVRDLETISQIEKTTGRKVGLIAEDKYWIWLNDPVKFPNDKYGVYGRIIWIQGLKSFPGVAVMPVLPNGKIALNRNYRHATRSWEYELPRGGVNKDESMESAAAREVKEETGMIIDQLHLLGQMAPDTGITNTIVPVYFAKVAAKQEAVPEESEAIAGIEAFSIEEIKQGFVDGYLPVKIDGKLCQISLRDPFLAFAILQAEARHLVGK
jgi:ADP-ribose pyrophosphatase